MTREPRSQDGWVRLESASKRRASAIEHLSRMDIYAGARQCSIGWFFGIRRIAQRPQARSFASARRETRASHGVRVAP
jgi:hypothetical protein